MKKIKGLINAPFTPFHENGDVYYEPISKSVIGHTLTSLITILAYGMDIFIVTEQSHNRQKVTFSKVLSIFPGC